jgi:hypothetical protein
MLGRLTHALPVFGFAICVGHLAWNCWLGPPYSPNYRVGGPVTALSAPNSVNNKQLYLRRLLFLPRRPRHAWIEVLGRDAVQLYVNGKLVDGNEIDGYNVGIVRELTSVLEVGANTIAVVAHQTALDHVPVVAIRGAYLLENESGEHPMWDDDTWRCSTNFQRGPGGWWYTNDFHDRNWPLARTSTVNLRCSIDFPPRARTAPRNGRWIDVPALKDRRAAFRRDFDIPSRPRQTWIRVTAPASTAYRMAVNGVLVDEREDRLLALQRGAPTQCSYDITPLVHSGSNVLCLLVQNGIGPAQILADVEAEDDAGVYHHFDTDQQWTVCAGMPKGWLNISRDRSIQWLPCQVEAGELDVPPWLPVRADVQLSLPLATALRRSLEEAAVMVAVGLLALLTSRLIARLFTIGQLTAANRKSRAAWARLPFLIPMIVLAGGFLLLYDPRVPRQEVFRPLWLWLAALSVPFQWALIGTIFAFQGRNSSDRIRRPHAGLRASSYAALLILAGITVVGFGLRFRLIAAEPLQADEVTLYNYCQGWLKEGFPSLQVGNDLPRYYICGCELESLGTALGLLIFNEDVYAVRMPTVCYGTLTILLTYFIGRRLFNPAVGLVAAALYALSPWCCEKAAFGRYESQLQVFTLLTVYFFWRTLHTKGPLSRPYLCLTGMAYVGMFLSWEGSAILAPAMVVFALIYRRNNLRIVLTEPVVWIALFSVLAIIILQQAHNLIQLNHFLLEGTGWGDIKLTAMWKFAFFKPWRYVQTASWNADGLVPGLGLLAAAFFAVRHRWRQPLRLLLISLLVTSLLFSLLIPLVAARYSYNLLPLFILLAAAALVAITEVLVPRNALARVPGFLRTYGRCLQVLIAVVVVVLGSGVVIELRGMPSQVVAGVARYALLQEPDLQGPVAYISEHYQPGDVIMAQQPEVYDHYAVLPISRRSSPVLCDYGLETVLQLYMPLPDSVSTPIHRFCGIPMIPDMESMNTVLTRSKRVWYVSVPAFDALYNSGISLALIDQNMDVVYEDFQSAVFLRDANRTASRRQIEQEELRAARVDFFH